jgi:hypothetical protein
MRRELSAIQQSTPVAMLGQCLIISPPVDAMEF